MRVTKADRALWRTVYDNWRAVWPLWCGVGLCISLSQMRGAGVLDPQAYLRLKAQLRTYAPTRPFDGYWWNFNEYGRRKRVAVLNKLINGELGPNRGKR